MLRQVTHFSLSISVAERSLTDELVLVLEPVLVLVLVLAMALERAM